MSDLWRTSNDDGPCLAKGMQDVDANVEGLPTVRHDCRRSVDHIGDHRCGCGYEWSET